MIKLRQVFEDRSRLRPRGTPGTSGRAVAAAFTPRRPLSPRGRVGAAPRRPPRPQRWAAAVAALLDLQDDYRAWLDSLPANLESSRLAEKLQAIVELDLDELETIDPPRGYGRD